MAAPGLVEVSHVSTCKRCGEQQCAWYKTKAGKWMLCSALGDGKGHVVACIFQPHKCSPELLKARAEGRI